MSLQPQMEAPRTPSAASAMLYAESGGLNTPAPDDSSLLTHPKQEPSPDIYEKPSDEPTRAKSRRLKWILAGVVALVVLIVAIVPAAVVTSSKLKNNLTSSPSNNNNNSSNDTDNGNSGSNDSPNVPDPSTEKAITGGDGSIVETENGNFTYKNPFGGYWVHDPKDPFNNGARAQSWTPALNETWNWGKDVIRGVNLGGWLVLEPFISPAMFEKYSTAPVPPVDEYSLSQLMRADGTLNELEEHYKTFITEKDFADIAGAGLNWIRLPVGFWAIQTFADDPYLEGVSWKYVVKAFQWARKYGLRVKLDLHAHPGSQNGWNHSGYKGGETGINWLRGIMGIANAQRSLDYIRVLTQFISQEQYAPVVPMFGVVNEPRMAAMERIDLETFYYEAYKVVRSVTGIGKGPVFSIHDGFDPEYTDWFGFLSGGDRVSLDVHPYMAFDGPNPGPPASYITEPCTRWAARTNATQQQFGIATAGEFSAAINDCGLWVADSGPAYAGDCSQWENWQSWDQATKDTLKTVVLASMDALQHYFFWTWRIGESLQTGTVRAPFWAYKLGMEHGWIPTDPREAVGTCQSLGVPMNNPFDGNFLPWQIGNDPNAQPANTAAYIWPPASLGPLAPASWLPTYAPTAPIIKLEGAEVPSGVDGGDGWFNDADTTLMMAPRPGCTYPNAYTASTLPPPSGPVCPA